MHPPVYDEGIRMEEPMGSSEPEKDESEDEEPNDEEPVEENKSVADGYAKNRRTEGERADDRYAKGS